MTPAAFEAWVKRLGKAWEARDARAAANLFAEDVYYQEDPFAEPLRGREAVHTYWAEVPKTQRDIHFDFEILAVTAERAVLHWQVSLIRIPTGTRVRLDGVSVGTFNAAGLCESWREWWHREEASS